MVVAVNCNSTDIPSLSPFQEQTVTSQKPKWCRTDKGKSEKNATKHPLLTPCKEVCNKCKTRLPNNDSAIINSRF